jgi:hypothetical protein
MARSILVRVSSPLDWTQSPGKPLLYRSGYIKDEASLYSGRRRSTSTSQAQRCGALLSSHERGCLQRRLPNDEDAKDDERRTTDRETRRVSSTKQEYKNAEIIFGAKLDGLATRNTARSGRDV